MLRLLAHLESLDTNDPAWISRASSDHIQRQWDDIKFLSEQGEPLPLFGVPFAVKDNIDVAGLPTTAACPDFSYLPAKDAEVIRLLKAAGAVVLGKTNLDAFATGLVGTRSPYGAVPNSFNGKYISGGSSSGSASVVARGLVPFALGTDTAGSGRVPAGLNNIVGLKATRGALSARGVVPACRTLDCVSILALTISDAQEVFRVAGQYDDLDSYSRAIISQPSFMKARPKIAICDNPPWFGKHFHRDAYSKSLQEAENMGWELIPTSFSLLFKLADLLYEGPWVAERFAAIKSFINKPGVTIDPVVQNIIQRATNFSATDFFDKEYLKNDLIRAIENQFESFDTILVPTTPTFPTTEEVRSEPLIENARLGTYTNFVNFRDWTALSVPAGFRSDGLPFGLTIISTRWQEDKLCRLGSQRLSAAGPRQLGATQTRFEEHALLQFLPEPESTIYLAVVGAHMSGFPLNAQLKETGATFSCVAKTSSSYRLYALPPTTGIRKPGMKRTAGNEVGCSIEIEIWNVSSEGLGNPMNSVPSPLAIGSVEISDRTWVKGFVCEPCGMKDALDISSFGGWRSWHLTKGLAVKNTSVVCDP